MTSAAGTLPPIWPQLAQLVAAWEGSSIERVKPAQQLSQAWDSLDRLDLLYKISQEFDLESRVRDLPTEQVTLGELAWIVQHYLDDQKCSV